MKLEKGGRIWGILHSSTCFEKSLHSLHFSLFLTEPQEKKKKKKLNDCETRLEWLKCENNQIWVTCFVVSRDWTSNSFKVRVLEPAEVIYKCLEMKVTSWDSCKIYLHIITWQYSNKLYAFREIPVPLGTHLVPFKNTASYFYFLFTNNKHH